MTKDNINLGILGCASITPLSIIMPSREIPNLTIYGLASNDFKRAEAYALKYKIPQVFESYQQLINSDEIDCVYIALSNDLHGKWSLNALNNNKHVLVEKPACLKEDDFKEIIQLCNKKNLNCLEAVMVRHHPWQNKIIEIIESGKYGKLLKIETTLNFLYKDNFYSNYRALPEKGGGVFYDLAVYWLQFTQLFGNIKTADYNGHSDFQGPNKIDWEFNAQLHLENGIHSEFNASFNKPYTSSHKLKLEHAVISIPDFFIPYYGKRKMTIHIHETSTDQVENYVFEPQGYFYNQLSYFCHIIRQKTMDCFLDETRERIIMMKKIYDSARQETT